MKKITMKDNKRAVVSIVNKIDMNITTIKQITNSNKKICLDCYIEKIEETHYKSCDIIKLKIKDETGYIKGIYIKDKSNNQLVVGKIYKMSGLVTKIFYIKKIFIIKEIELKD